VTGRTHELVNGFDPATYERGRPGYPTPAIDRLREVLPLGPGRVVVDLGAGTGKLARALAPSGATLIAVEPLEGMRTEFQRHLPGARVVDGTAESIPLPNRSADALVSGQAFHWFRVEPAAAEIARVLRPGGGLGLIWNLRDESVPWVARFGGILDRHDPGAPRAARGAWRKPLESSGLFTPVEHETFPFHPEVPVASLVDRGLSVSFIGARPKESQRKIAREIDRLAATDPALAGRTTIRFPYRTEVYWCHRR